MILAAAIRQNKTIYTLPPPARHHDIIRYMADDLSLPIPIIGEQGFIATEMEFVSRIPAKKIALKCGQVKKGAGQRRELFSEDMW